MSASRSLRHIDRRANGGQYFIFGQSPNISYGVSRISYGRRPYFIAIAPLIFPPPERKCRRKQEKSCNRQRGLRAAKNFMKKSAISRKKRLHSWAACSIIIRRDCTRYAMKREVAAVWRGIFAEYVRSRTGRPQIRVKQPDANCRSAFGR